jgi:hypothetical protein
MVMKNGDKKLGKHHVSPVFITLSYHQYSSPLMQQGVMNNGDDQ